MSKQNKEIIVALDMVLQMIDRMTTERGKRNIYYADEIATLRNRVVELQEKFENKKI